MYPVSNSDIAGDLGWPLTSKPPQVLQFVLPVTNEWT